MTYHPKLLMPCALFLATKTENHYTPLSTFASQVPSTSEDVLAPEFLLTQGLRFTFDVRHPFRGLEGGFMEMIALADGKGKGLGMDDSIMFSIPPSGAASSGTLPRDAESTDDKKGNNTKRMTPSELKRRIIAAHTAAKDLLKTAALLTDAYFLYTPSQIWLSGVYAVDEPLVRAYLDAKFPTPLPSSSPSPSTSSSKPIAIPPPASSTQPQTHSQTSSTTMSNTTQEKKKGEDEARTKEKEEKELERRSELKMTIIATIHRLAKMQQDPQIAQIMHPTGEYLKELKRIDKKLYTCRNPERTDLVGLNQSLRNSGGGGGGDKKEEGAGGGGREGEGRGEQEGGDNGKKKNGNRSKGDDGDVFGGPLK